MKYLAHNPTTGKTYTADTIPDLIDQFVTFTSTTYKAEGYAPAAIHSYTRDWPPEEIRIDRAPTVARRLTTDTRWQIFRNLYA